MLVIMDPYTRYCFDYLKIKYPDYLREIGFEREEDILMLDKRKETAKEEKKVLCKFCNKEEAVVRSHQIRSADEGETLVTYCRKCDKVF